MDIEKKVMVIKEEIIEKARQQKGSLISKEEDKWDKKYKEFQKRLKNREEEINLYYKQEAERKREQIISRTILDRKQARRRSIDRCINRFINELKEKLHNFSNEPEYKDFLLESVKKTVKLLDGKDFVINMSRKDISRGEELTASLNKDLPDYNFSIRESDRTKSGGIILEQENGNEMVEYTFDTVINYLKEEIAIEIQEEVFI